MWELFSHNIYILPCPNPIKMMEELESTGLDPKEAKIYLALLKIGRGTANQIMLKTNIERRTIYDVLERLIQKGYATYYKESRTTIYTPTDPLTILHNLEDKKDDFKKIIPQLASLKEAEENVEVEIFKGREGVKNAFFDVINNSKMHYAFGNVSLFNEQFTVQLKKALSKIESKGYREKIIYPKGKEMMTIKGGEYRQLDQKLMPPSPVVIYNDVTCLFIMGDPPMVIKIKSKEIAKTHLAYFNTYWEMSKPPKGKK
jgi:sugar-specific transcriptional regulator TrmB